MILVDGITLIIYIC